MSTPPRLHPLLRLGSQIGYRTEWMRPSCRSGPVRVWVRFGAVLQRVVRPEYSAEPGGRIALIRSILPPAAESYERHYNVNPQRRANPFGLRCAARPGVDRLPEVRLASSVRWTIG